MGRTTHLDILAANMPFTVNEAGVSTFAVSMGEAAESPKIIVADYPPGFSYAPHTHACDYAEYVVSGHITVGKRTYGPGDLRVVRGGVGYGPLSTGDEGCRLLLIFSRGNDFDVELLPRPRKAA